MRNSRADQEQTRSKFHVYPTHEPRNLSRYYLGRQGMANPFSYCLWDLKSIHHIIIIEANLLNLGSSLATLIIHIHIYSQLNTWMHILYKRQSSFRVSLYISYTHIKRLIQLYYSFELIHYKSQDTFFLFILK